ncbi:hypothetical protein RHGRI_000130 [Rhododendron griersonianum]|uniref:Uncharacterized protein n=1 Tax=Rhododendron griersonianum TaxID=479676 RepID=A0AAV6LFS9_9ERIC|nr:hypothetical protein RHGRI_000130 [Rhododendron griersonianum]
MWRNEENRLISENITRKMAENWEFPCSNGALTHYLTSNFVCGYNVGPVWIVKNSC